MTINEKDRLDLRQELERLFSNPRLATIAMEAMPPIDYSQLATKSDLAALETRLVGTFAGIDGQFTAIDGRFDALEGRFTAIDGQFTAIDGRFTAIDGRFDALEGRFTAIDGKIHRVHGDLERTMAAQLRTIVMMQIATIAAVTGIIQANL